jgi:hypothetical protein
MSISPRVRWHDQPGKWRKCKLIGNATPMRKSADPTNVPGGNIESRPDGNFEGQEFGDHATLNAASAIYFRNLLMICGDGPFPGRKYSFKMY